MKKKKKLLFTFSIVIAAIAILALITLGFIYIYAATNINYDFDEKLFEKSREWNSTAFYANASPYSDTYTPEEVEISGSIKKAFYSLDEISPYIIDGFIAVEDKDFYTHKGIDVKRTIYATLNYIFKREKLFGASTITQQVIKNISGDNDISISRKFSEILRAMHIENRFSKDEILEVYLNVIPMSEGMYGVGIASRTYFGKSPGELSCQEAATLIGITNAPSAYNPYNNPERCKKKRNNVLSVMYSGGIISEEEYNEAINTPIKVVDRQSQEDRYDSWFVETVIDDVSEDMAAKYSISLNAARMMLLGGGYSVYTTMDTEVQKYLEKYFENTDNFSEEIKNGLNYSMAITDSRNGNLIAVVGRVGEKKANRLLNHAKIPHTPGSVTKPLGLYAPLIDEGEINWATVFDDVPECFTAIEGGYKEYPKNSPNVYDGLTTVKDAVRLSKNTVAVRLAEMRGVDNVYKTLKNKLGFDTLIDKQMSDDGRTLTDIASSPMALGQLTKGVSVLKLTEAYGTFANDGVMRKMRSYIDVKDSSGDTILENKAESEQVFKESTARIMNRLLMEVTESGTAAKIQLKNIVDTAGKTGTSGNNKDKMFIGYTPYYTAGIWCGYESKGASVASVSPSHLEIWDDIMITIHQRRFESEKTVKKFSDEGLLYLPYCRDSGELYCENCIYDPRGDRLEYGYFSQDNVPSGLCSRHILVKYDSESKGVATKYCPKENLVTVSLIKVPDRRFPKEIFVTDAEYVYRDVSGYQDCPTDTSLPYYYYSLPEGEYCGIANRKKQFNSSCPHHGK